MPDILLSIPKDCSAPPLYSLSSHVAFSTCLSAAFAQTARMGSQCGVQGHGHVSSPVEARDGAVTGRGCGTDSLCWSGRHRNSVPRKHCCLQTNTTSWGNSTSLSVLAAAHVASLPPPHPPILARVLFFFVIVALEPNKRVAGRAEAPAYGTGIQSMASQV